MRLAVGVSAAAASPPPCLWCEAGGIQCGATGADPRKSNRWAPAQASSTGRLQLDSRHRCFASAALMLLVRSARLCFQSQLVAKAHPNSSRDAGSCCTRRCFSLTAVCLHPAVAWQ